MTGATSHGSAGAGNTVGGTGKGSLSCSGFLSFSERGAPGGVPSTGGMTRSKVDAGRIKVCEVLARMTQHAARRDIADMAVMSNQLGISLIDTRVRLTNP